MPNKATISSSESWNRRCCFVAAGTLPRAQTTKSSCGRCGSATPAGSNGSPRNGYGYGRYLRDGSNHSSASTITVETCLFNINGKLMTPTLPMTEQEMYYVEAMKH